MNSRIQKMAQIIINYSLAVRPGERVLLRGMSPLAEPLVAALYQEALKAGGEAFTYIHMSSEHSLAMEATDNIELLAKPNPMLLMMYETCNAIVRVEAEENLKERSEYPEDKQAARRSAAYAPIDIQMKREGKDPAFRRTTTQYPTQAYAQQAGISLLQYQDFVFKACKVHLDDPVAAWHKVGEFQDKLVKYLDGKKNIHVRGKNIDLHLSIEGRKFKSAEGKENFPDGEIFTGPVETSVNGWVKFTYPAFYSGNEVIGAALTFQDGKVVKATAEKNEKFLNDVLDTDEGSRHLGEFAIGTNTDIQRFTGSILYDEKIGGTVHMAVGQGYQETNSVNNSSVHWDMICDMREGGEILVDGELFYKDGKFVRVEN